MRKQWRYIWVVLMVLTACAPTKPRSKDWTSIPPVQMAKNRYYDARIEPVKRDKRFFVAFRLDVVNKTDGKLTIDWNRTRYLHKGKPYGAFAFRGINPEDIRKNIPPETIARGETFSREIFPVNLVAFAPMREEVLDQKGKGLFPGPIPGGQNGIRLVIRPGREEIIETLTVEIR